MPPKAKPLDPPLGERQGRVPQATKEQRVARDNRIMALHIAGYSEREIGKIVNITGQRVHQIIKTEMKKEARHQQLVTDQALQLYCSRLDALLRAVWGKALSGDLKAVESARRVLEQMGRLYDIEEERTGALPPANELLNGDGGGFDPRDELAAFRAKHLRSGDGSFVHEPAAGGD